MNQKNFEFLRDQIKYSGFGETLENALKEKMQKGETEFSVRHEATYGTDSLTASLNFKKSDQSDMYFFNSYKINLSSQTENSNKAVEQTFYINNDSKITLKEAYNLLEGRAVNKDLKNKEGEVYNAWVKLNFKEADSNGNFKLHHYHQNYGYDLEASLAKHSIKELENPQFKEDLLNSLKKGNVQSVTFVVGGVEKKQFIEANPHFKTINVYDGSMQRINNRESKEEKQSESHGQSVNKDVKQKQDNASESSDKEPREKKQKKKQSNSI